MKPFKICFNLSTKRKRDDFIEKEKKIFINGIRTSPGIFRAGNFLVPKFFLIEN